MHKSQMNRSRKANCHAKVTLMSLLMRLFFSVLAAQAFIDYPQGKEAPDHFQPLHRPHFLLTPPPPNTRPFSRAGICSKGK
jgi:hypothetical protein